MSQPCASKAPYEFGLAWGLSFKVFPDHRHHFARYSSQADIIDQEQAQADADRVGVFPAVLLARHRARFKFPAGTGEHQLLAPDEGLVGSVDGCCHTYRLLAENFS